MVCGTTESNVLQARGSQNMCLNVHAPEFIYFVSWGLLEIRRAHQEVAAKNKSNKEDSLQKPHKDCQSLAVWDH